jgi:MFS transporter, DHA1 family, multidrug resistance protein B
MMLDGIDRNVKLRIGVMFVHRFVDIMLIPLMVIHFASLYGAATAGLLTVVAAAVAICATFLGGHLSDVHGRRPTLLVGEVGGFFAYAGLVLANSPWWESGVATYVFYLFVTALGSIVRPASDGMVIDVSTPEQRPMIYAINYWATNVAMVFGSLIGGFLYAGYFFHLLLASAVLELVIAVVSWVAMTETAPDGVVPDDRHWLASMLRGYVQVLQDRLFAKLFLAILFFTMVQMQLQFYIGVRLADEFPPMTLFALGSWELSVDGISMMGILRAINTALVVVLALLAVRLFRRLSDWQKLCGGTIVFVAGHMVLAVTNDPWLLIAATVVFTLGELMTAPTRQTLLASVAPEEARSRYMAVYQLVFRLAMVFASLSVTLGALVSPLVMSLLYGLLGAASVVLSQSVLVGDAERQARELAREAP